ncbi:hypothetical protein GE061_011247 [Apolygus lucorum]|uniref:Mevalonate kinase n=1 Tax=Apolygus lucorum TaxID=248454 RepID=A0A8S9XX97_APOLU|nr:hypothetical protein GE061_011247 [Apolygus lucorum]
MSFSISAPGKVILIGEHSVLYNKQGLAAAINKRTYLHFKEHKQAHDQITFNLLKTVSEWDFKSVYNLIILDKPLSVGMKEFSIFTPELLRHEEFVTTALAIGAGTGSSAAFATCVAGAVYHYIRLKAFEKHGSGEYNISYEMFKPYKMALTTHYCGFSDEDKEVINKWAFCVEKIMHGTPSGLDNTVCTFGNAVLINPQGRKEDESNLKVLDSFPSLRILLINTEVPRKTSDLARRIADLKRAHPDSVGAVIDAMGIVADEFIKIFIGLKELAETSDTNNAVFRQLETLIDLQHGLLATLGVSHVRLDEICLITKRRGLHSKLTGAGGGGHAYTLVPPDASEETLTQTISDLQAAGFLVDDIMVNGEGIAIDFK